MAQDTRKIQVVVVGGGVIGLSVGWQLARNGMEVHLFEKGEVGQSTSHVAAGMLAPQAEANFEEIALMRLGQKSLNLYPELLDALSEDTEDVPELNACGTLLAAVDRSDTNQLKRLFQFRKDLDLEIDWLTGTEAREKEPLLSPRIASGMSLPGDAEIDNRHLVQALKKAFLHCGGILYEHQPIDAVSRKEDGFLLKSGEIEMESKELVWAKGSEKAPVIHDKAIRPPATRPVKGQILALQQTRDCQLHQMIRSPRVYLVPKADGTLLVGGTSEEKGFDIQPTGGGVKDLLEEAWHLVPGIYELPFLGVEVGLRPATVDHAPAIGKSSIDGVCYAVGHYRHGYLLTPVTALGIVNDLLGNAQFPVLNDFRPERFQD